MGTAELAKALAVFQGSVTSIVHNAEGQEGHRKYTYATLSALLDAVRAPLSANGLSVVQLVGDSTLTTRLLHVSGESIESTMPLSFAGRTMREIGSQITYCRRYQLGAILNLASEADDDGEAANGKAGKLASTFSMAEPPMNLKQQLIASLAAESKKPEVVEQKPARGNGITALRARMHELNGALREASDLDMLEGTLRGFQDDLCECQEKLPDWHAAAETAIAARRKALSTPA
jgi:hypothetical protein